MGRLVTESGMLQEASTEEAKAWNASARRIWMVKPTCSTQYSTLQYSIVQYSIVQYSIWMEKPTCWFVMSRYTCTVELYTVSLVT